MMETRSRSAFASAMRTRDRAPIYQTRCSASRSRRRKRGRRRFYLAKKLDQNAAVEDCRLNTHQEKTQQIAGVSVEISAEDQAHRQDGSASASDEVTSKRGRAERARYSETRTTRKASSRQSLSGPSKRLRRSPLGKGCPSNTWQGRSQEVVRVCEKEIVVEDHIRGLEKMQCRSETVKSRNIRDGSRETCAVDRNNDLSDPVEDSRPENGWTADQEVALQNAYIQLRPSPKFWLEISKKVPGKTPKECFDRFYSAYPTPPVPQPRTRKLVAESPIRCISFPSPMSAVKSRHHSGGRKLTLLQAHKTVRHILRKQQVADGNYEADVFTAVELVDHTDSCLEACPNRVTSPLCTYAESSIITPHHYSNLSAPARDREPLWSSTYAKTKTRFRNVDQIQYSAKESVRDQVLSPEVLKREDNPARLDRYLTMLHSRRVEKRKSSFHKWAAEGRFLTHGSLPTEPALEKSSVSAARDAILADANDMLKAVFSQQASAKELYDETEDESSLLADE